MKIERLRKRTRGQSLVEYALLLALVAIVAAGILTLVGSGVARVFGVLTGALGTRAETHKAVLWFEPNQLPRCGYYAPQGTGFYMKGWSTAPLSELSVSFDIPLQATITDAGAQQFQIYVQLTPPGISDTSGCPHSVVIQASPQVGGAMAVSPVEIKDW